MNKNEQNQDGYATAEFALVIPAFIVLLSLVLGVFAAGAAKVQTCAQARSAARAVSIGNNPVDHGAMTTTISESGQWITATSKTTLGGKNSWVPQISCQIKTIREPDYATIY